MGSGTHPWSAGQRPSKRIRLARAMRVSGAIEALLRIPSWRGVIAVSYHRIGDPRHSDLHEGLFSATPEMLDEQLRLLHRRFDLLTASELRDADLRVPGRRVLVTFDDGYRDLHKLALPVLTASDVRATVFLCSGFLDGTARAWWDEIAWMIHRATEPELAAGPWSSEPLTLAGPARPLSPEGAAREHAIAVATRAYWRLAPGQTEPFLTGLAAATGAGRRPQDPDGGDWITWEMAAAIAASGHEIGAHSLTHPILATLPPERQAAEISGSVDRIEAKLGTRPRSFAYPVGTRDAFSSVTAELAREAGIEFAFSNYGGYAAGPELAPFDIRRLSSEMLRDSDVFRATFALPRLFARVGG